MPHVLQVLQRAIDAGIDLIVAFTTDFDKGDLIMKVARENSGEHFQSGTQTSNNHT